MLNKFQLFFLCKKPRERFHAFLCNRYCLLLARDGYLRLAQLTIVTYICSDVWFHINGLKEPVTPLEIHGPPGLKIEEPVKALTVSPRDSMKVGVLVEEIHSGAQFVIRVTPDIAELINELIPGERLPESDL